MMKKRLQFAGTLILILLVLTSCSEPTSGTEEINKKLQEEYEYCWQLLNIYLLFRDYLPEMDDYHTPASLFEAVDEPYTRYFDSEKAQEILDMLDTENTGYGIIIDSTATGYVIDYVVHESPADQAGLMVNDTIVAVDGTPVQGLSETALQEVLGADIGETKTLTIHRPDVGEMDVQVTIDVFYEPAVIVDSLQSDVAYIYLSTFLSETGTPGGSAEEFEAALNQTDWADYTILDLSYNTGGELNQCAQITSEFFNENTPLILIRQRTPNESGTGGVTVEDTLRSLFDGHAVDRKFLVLFNTYSASATELLIAALRSQRDDILLIGENTYGKARGQVYALTPMEGLATVTFSLFKPLDGISYDLTGIEPDIALGPRQDGIELALEQIESGLAKRAGIRSKLRRIAALHEHQQVKPVLPLFIRIR